MPATHQVETSGVRNRGWMWPNVVRAARARRAIDSAVRDAGMIVVWVEAIAEVATAKQHDPVPAAEHLGREQAEDELLLLGVLGQELGARVGDDREGDRRRTCTSRMTVERIAARPGRGGRVRRSPR